MTVLSPFKFNYRDNTACDFHHREGSVPRCALGQATHRALAMFDIFCKSLGIPLTKGHEDLLESKKGVNRNNHVQMGKPVFVITPALNVERRQI